MGMKVAVVAADCTALYRFIDPDSTEGSTGIRYEILKIVNEYSLCHRRMHT